MSKLTAQRTNWREVKLGDICRIKTGKTDVQDAVEYGVYPLFDRSATIKRSNKFLFDTSAIILPGEGAEFTPRFYEGKFDLHQRVYAIYCDEEKRCDNLNLKFLYYFLFLNREYFAQTATGATVKSLRLPIIADCPVTLPPFTTQKQIADVLSTYDDLIENNTKRIKILEEIAQAIYKEWFVYFRFPGHEKVKMIDSKTEFGKVPEGWEIVQMKEIADVVDCLHSKKPENIKTGNNILLQLNNILDNGTIDLTEKYLISEADYKEWASRIELQSGDCVVTNVGRIAAVAQIPDGIRAALGRNMTGIRPRKIPASFLIEYLLSPHMKSEVQRKKDAGAIMDSLNVKNIYLLDVIIPPQNILSEFDNFVSPVRKLMNSIVAKNQMLRRARDLLLPKLVTGEINVK